MGVIKTTLWLMFWPLILHFSILRFVLNSVSRAVHGVVERLQGIIDWLVDRRDDIEELAESWIGMYHDDATTPIEAEILNCRINRKPHRFARYLAKRAYLQFGHRKKSDADMMVTRKWLRNYVQEHYTSLRLQHQIEAIDEALFLSYIPTETYQECEEYAATKAYTELLPTGSAPL